MQIPIQNIYYLLCYAWDKLDEKEIVNVSGRDATELLDLFAQVLINGTTYILKRGLDRYYIDKQECYNGIKGKLQLEPTIKTNVLPTKRTVCSFDEFSYNILHNQILKSTLCRLMRYRQLDDDLRNKLKKLIIKFPPIDEIILKQRVFSRVHLHKNNYFYDFVLKICEIIFQSTYIDESTGELKFRDFIRDEHKMSYLFEAFVRNFYKRECSEYSVTRENLAWDFTPLSDNSRQFLPTMQTDITLQSKRHKIIIDTKFKQKTLQSNYETEKIHSDNLYQLFSYIKNAEAKDHLGETCDGILLYPTIDKEVKLDYQYQKHKIKIRTINLNQNWRDIAEDLHAVLE